MSTYTVTDQASPGIRASFVARFGEEQAAIIERAAREHILADPAHHNDSRGSDAFRYDLLAAIAYECVTRPAFREHHGITVPEADLREWALTEGRLGEHDGDAPSYMALLCGYYDGWMTEVEQVEAVSR